MAIPEHFLAELRSRVGLVDLVGRRVKLTRRGREHTGLCPFHNEKTPSFTVNEDKGFYHCFGCSAHGGAIDFVMNTEGLSFPEAVERLAGEAGMEVPQSALRDREAEERRKNLYDVMQIAADWFEGQLAGLAGDGARQYIEGR
ncbi:MAG: CHC2 zinc finger domain-containing protein, partial [Alphaproteobacteria bacterium]|nr:CHC2 zinc finger domain-containing protein [Alphaproteobacteria bacterium]